MGTVLITSLFALHLIFSPPLISQATASPVPRGQLIKEQAQIRNEERKATIAARLTEARRTRLQNYFNRLIKRLEAATSRLQILINRIESRIVKIEEADEDIDTGPISEQVNDAKAKLKVTTAQLQEAKDVFGTLLAADDPKASFETVRENIMDIKKALIEVHKILVHVIGDIKGLRVGATSSSSPIPSPAASPSP